MQIQVTFPSPNQCPWGYSHTGQLQHLDTLTGSGSRAGSPSHEQKRHLYSIERTPNVLERWCTQALQERDRWHSKWSQWVPWGCLSLAKASSLAAQGSPLTEVLWVWHNHLPLSVQNTQPYAPSRCWREDPQVCPSDVSTHAAKKTGSSWVPDIKTALVLETWGPGDVLTSGRLPVLTDLHWSTSNWQGALSHYEAKLLSSQMVKML